MSRQKNHPSSEIEGVCQFSENKKPESSMKLGIDSLVHTKSIKEDKPIGSAVLM